MTRFRRDAIGLVWPPRQYQVSAAELEGAPLGLALAYAFGGERELADPRLGEIPLRLWEHIVGGEIELRAGEVDPKDGDVITSVGRVAEVRDRAAGQELIIDTASQNQHGEMTCEARFLFRIPGSGGTASAGDSGAFLRPKRDTEPPPTSAMRSTQIGRFDFVEIRATRADGPGAPETDPLKSAIEAISSQLTALGTTRIRSVRARILAPVQRGSEIVIHGKRDPRRTGVILFEAVGRAGLKLLDAGVAEIAI